MTANDEAMHSRLWVELEALRQSSVFIAAAMTTKDRDHTNAMNKMENDAKTKHDLLLSELTAMRLAKEQAELDASASQTTRTTLEDQLRQAQVGGGSACYECVF